MSNTLNSETLLTAFSQVVVQLILETCSSVGLTASEKQAFSYADGSDYSDTFPLVFCS